MEIYISEGDTLSKIFSPPKDIFATMLNQFEQVLFETESMIDAAFYATFDFSKTIKSKSLLVAIHEPGGKIYYSYRHRVFLIRKDSFTIDKENATTELHFSMPKDPLYWHNIQGKIEFSDSYKIRTTKKKASSESQSL